MRRARGLAQRAAAVCVSLAALTTAAQGEPQDGATLTSALRLATLSERIAKLHAQAGQGILVERSRRATAQALRDFDATLRSVAAKAATQDSRDNYALLALLAQDYREWALRSPTREGARKLRPRAEEIAWIAAKGASLLQQEGRVAVNGASVRAQNAATLAQRVAKLQLWARWDLRDEALGRELRDSQQNLRRIFDSLAASPGASAAIVEELQAAAIQLRFMEDAERALAAHDNPARQIEFIAKTGDHIEESMGRVAQLYDAAR